MICALVSGSSGPGSNPGRGHMFFRNRDKLWPDWLVCRKINVTIAVDIFDHISSMIS